MKGVVTIQFTLDPDEYNGGENVEELVMAMIAGETDWPFEIHVDGGGLPVERPSIVFQTVPA